MKEPAPVETPFDKGKMELQVGAGAFFSINTDGGSKPEINDADLNLRLGWMLTTPSGDSWCRGNFEFLVEAFGALVFEGPGDGMAGVTLLLRYNFVQPDAKLVPYFQIGAGGLWNNIHNDVSQRLIGQEFEFNLQAAFGVRYMLNERAAIFGEFGIRHISNANSADRNIGLNSVGGLVGMSWFF